MPAHAPQPEDPAGRPIRVALAGFGLAGEILHLPLLKHAGFDVCAVLTSRTERARQCLPAAQVVPAFDDLLAVPGIELLVIATPNDLHARQAAAALDAGLHVVVDKPVALSVRQLDELMDHARRQRRWLVPFHNRRFDADWLTVRGVCDGGELGRIVQFRARWDRYRPAIADRWRERAAAGGGILLDLGTHLIDQAVSLFGMPQWLTADIRRQRQGAAVDDGFEILMECRGVQVSLAASMLAAAADARYRVHGTDGSFVKAGMDPQEDWLRGGGSPADDGFGVEAAEQWGVLTLAGQPRRVASQRGHWPAFYARLRRCLCEGGEPPVAAQAARDVLRVIEAARASCDEGRRIALT